MSFPDVIPLFLACLVGLFIAWAVVCLVAVELFYRVTLWRVKRRRAARRGAVK